MEHEQNQKAIDFDLVEEHKEFRSNPEGRQPDREDDLGLARGAVNLTKKIPGGLRSRGITIANQLEGLIA